MAFYRKVFLSDTLYDALLVHAMQTCAKWGDLLFPLQDVRATLEKHGDQEQPIAITVHMSIEARQWFVRNGFKVQGNEIVIQ